MKTRAAIFTVSLLLSGMAMTALPAHGQDSQISQLSGRIQQLEERTRALTQSLSSATGANEELAHQIQELRQKIDAQQKDFAYRLCMVSAQQLGADASDQGLNCGAVGTAPAASGGVPQNYTPGAPLPPIGGNDNQNSSGQNSSGQNSNGQNFGGQTFNGPPPSGAPQQLGRSPGTLGTLPMNSGPGSNGAMNVPRTANPVGPSGGGGTARYDTAMNLLAKAQYAEASASFRAYADANPDDNDLSAQAIYWIGDIAYVQRDYPSATRAFAEQIKKYPDSNRSPDSMLKLGQALIAQGNTSGGCTTLGALKTKYPKAPAATLAGAASARKAACR
jgi:tol-pal system protein YbgF